MNRRTVFAFVLFGLAVAGCNEHTLAPIDMEHAHYTPPSALTAVEVDVLWVIDDSNSMAAEQLELGDRFGEFAEALASTGADFRVAVVSTSLNEGGLFRTGPGGLFGECEFTPAALERCQELPESEPFLTSSNYEEDGVLDSERLVAEFQCLAAAGTCGDASEAGLETMRLALENRAVGQGRFLRDDAHLLVVILSDEDDCSMNDAWPVGRGCEGAAESGGLIPVDHYYDFLVELKGGEPSRVMVAGLIGPPPSPGAAPGEETCISQLNGAETGAFDGSRYRELVELAGGFGVEESICQADFSDALDSITRVVRDTVGVRCLTTPPANCLVDADCSPGSACLPRGSDSGLCADFEVWVEVRAAAGGAYELMPGPGPIGDQVNPDAEYLVNWEANSCLHGVSVEFVPGARPETGSTIRVSYPRGLEVAVP